MYRTSVFGETCLNDNLLKFKLALQPLCIITPGYRYLWPGSLFNLQANNIAVQILVYNYLGTFK